MHKSPPSLRVLRLVRPLVSFLAAVVLLVVIGTGVLGVSAASLPGDPLYGIKRSFENFQVSLTSDPIQRANLEESYTRRRAEEIQAVQASNRATSVQFAAPLEAMDAGTWIVGGFTVQVPPGTPIKGTPQVGEFVEITGRTLPDGQIVANHIGVEGVEFVGVIEAMNPPAWIIGGQRVLVTTRTQIVGTARVSAQAEVHARLLPDDTLLALKIEFDDPDTLPLAQPTATPMPQPASTPYPTQIPIAPPQPVDTHERERNDVTPEAGGSREDHATPEPKPTEQHDKDAPEPTEGHNDKPERDNAHTPEPRHDNDSD